MEPVNGAVASEPARDELRERRDASPSELTRADRENLMRFMLMMRAAEERAITLYRQGKVPGSFYDGCGQEAISVGSSYVLGPRDRMCILHRDLGAHFVRGVTPDRYLANYMGRAGGLTGGKDGNMHFGDRELGCVGMVSMLPDMALVASGMALAFKLRARAARRDDLLRRGLDRQRPVARGDELRRHPPAAGRLRAREQRLRLLDPERARVRGRPARARGDLWLPRGR